MSSQEPKAQRHGYAPRPFFFQQRGRGGVLRFVAWTSVLEDQKRLFLELVRLLPSEVEVLLRIRRDRSVGAGGEASWRRYYGRVACSDLLAMTLKCEAFVFRDSRCQLCVRDPATLATVVFDDDGVIYVYAEAPAFRDVLARSGFEERQEDLVGEGFRFGQVPREGRVQQAEFIRRLRLQRVSAKDRKAIH
jgi:hypothetical protein